MQNYKKIFLGEGFELHPLSLFAVHHLVLHTAKHSKNMKKSIKKCQFSYKFFFFSVCSTAECTKINATSCSLLMRVLSVLTIALQGRDIQSATTHRTWSGCLPHCCYQICLLLFFSLHPITVASHRLYGSYRQLVIASLLSFYTYQIVMCIYLVVKKEINSGVVGQENAKHIHTVKLWTLDD